MNTKCILFDLDGVLVISKIFSLEYSKKYNVSIDILSEFFDNDFRKTTIGKDDLKEIIKPWLSKWNFDGDVDEFLKLWFESSRDIDERMIDFVNDCKNKGILCFIATNQEKYRTEYIMKDMGFDKIFDGIFSSCNIGFKKPDIEYFQFIIDKLKKDYNIDKDEVLFIDDSKKNVEVAENLGLKTFHYSSFDEFKNFIN